VVIGISADSVQDQAAFAKKYDLPFLLLCDMDHSVARAYGVWGKKTFSGREYEGIIRSTFLIGADGKVLKEWRDVKVEGHVDHVLSALP
jgi:peroxiredoxin Q/BCP